MMRCTKKMGICNSCVGLRAIDLTLHAPYLSTSPDQKLVIGWRIIWNCKSAPARYEGGFNPSRVMKGGL